eukprot:1205453-Amphidinium_carterae.1
MNNQKIGETNRQKRGTFMVNWSFFGRQESPYRQATSDEVTLWVSTSTLACLLRRPSREGVVDKTWGCGLCIRAIDKRSRLSESGKRKSPFAWTTSFEALMQHHSAQHADLKAVHQTLLKPAACWTDVHGALREDSLGWVRDFLQSYLSIVAETK